MSEDRPFPLHAGIATVAALADESESMRRFTLEAPEFRDPGVEQPGEIITLGWPGEDGELVMPLPRWRFPPGTPDGHHWRNFSVRRFDPAAGTLDVEFFLHGTTGRAAAWGIGAKTGDTIGFGGPRTHWLPAAGAEWHLLLADETGLPALLAIAENLPAGQRAVALIEVADERDRREAESAAAVEWHWVFRGERAAGTTNLMLELLKTIELPAGPGQVWGGGESLVMRDLRRHAAAEIPSLVSSQILGYWRHDSTPEDVD